MSLITDLRAKNFDEIIGNDNIKFMLRKIVNNPEKMPRNLIFSGSFGCCKTTFARVFARELNKGLTEDKYLIEIDSSNVAKVEDMKNTLPYISLPNTGCSYKVVIFDEAHLISKTAFSQLLKLIEENTRNIFFIFCTTEIHKLLETVRSRSLTFYVEDLNYDYMLTYLGKLSPDVFNPEYLQDTELLDILFLHSKGHYRDLIQQLELLRYQGKELYKENTFNYKELYFKIIEGDENAKRSILNLPLLVIEDSWDFFVKSCDIDITTVINHLQYRDKLHSTADWFLFFKIISKKVKKENIKIRK